MASASPARADLDLRDHVSRVPLRGYDFDWSQQLNSAVYVALLEVARWDWGVANGIDIRQHHVAAVVVRLELDYVRPVTFDPLGAVLVRTALEKAERYSFYLHQTIESLDGKIHADARLRMALFDTRQRQAVPVTAETLRGSAPGT
jgi:acyl-CoA thioesterase FadM